MKKIKEVLENILNSFKNNDEGYSARKISAFVIMVMIVCLHVKWFRSDRWEYIGEVLGFDFMFILSCLGLTTWQSIKEKSLDSEK